MAGFKNSNSVMMGLLINSDHGQKSMPMPSSEGDSVASEVITTLYNTKYDRVPSTSEIALRNLSKVEKIVQNQQGNVNTDVARAIVSQPDNEVSKEFFRLINLLEVQAPSIQHLDQPQKRLQNVLNLGQQVQHALQQQAQLKQQHSTRNSI